MYGACRCTLESYLEEHLRVVLEVIEELQSHNITRDDSFTSQCLGDELQKRKLTVLGTVRKNEPERIVCLFLKMFLQSTMKLLLVEPVLVFFTVLRHYTVWVKMTCNKLNETVQHYTRVKCTNGSLRLGAKLVFNPARWLTFAAAPRSIKDQR